MKCLNIIMVFVIVCIIDEILTKKSYKDNKVVLMKIESEVQLDAVKFLQFNAGVKFDFKIHGE